jgi:hypothetical protein
MKKTVILIAVCCFFFQSWAQFDNKLSELGLKGKVSSLVEIEYQLTNYDYNSKREERKTTFLFNQNGYKTKERYTSPSGEVLYLGTLTYSPSGKLIEEKVNNFEYKKNYIKKYVHTPKEISIDIEYESETPYLCEKYVLDSKKAVIQRIEYDRNIIVRTFDYSYNSAGKLRSETQKMQDALTIFNYTYNRKGQLETKTEVDTLGKVLHTQSYTYNENGYVESEITSYSDDPQKLTLTYKYVLDATGNWIEKQEFMDGNLFSLTVREISYY